MLIISSKYDYPVLSGESQALLGISLFFCDAVGGFIVQTVTMKDLTLPIDPTQSRVDACAPYASLYKLSR